MTRCDLIIKGKYVITTNNNSEIIKDGAVAIDKEKIVSIGNGKVIENNFQAEEVVDAGNSIIMPGLINAHTHVAMSYFRGLADDLGLDEWLEKHIWPAEAKYVKPDFVEKSTELGCLEMIKAGITCFNDMYFFEERTAEVVKKIGMRAVLGEGILDFSTPSCKTPAETIAKTVGLINKYRDDGLIHIAFAPHAIYTCSGKTLKEVKEKAGDNLIHIHISETKKERDDSIKKCGKTPVQYLDAIKFLDKNVVAAHCVWVDEKDLEVLAEKNVKIVHNPISNMKLASGMAPILSAYKKHKITVALGTDSAASNNTQDLFTDMRVAALMHKISNEDPVALSAEEIVKMATINGARALGWDAQIGSLTIGKQADIITIDLDQPHLQPIYNPYSHLVYCANAGDVSDVVINGKIIMRNRKLVDIDEEKIITEAKNFSEQMK